MYQTTGTNGILNEKEEGEEKSREETGRGERSQKEREGEEEKTTGERGRGREDEEGRERGKSEILFLYDKMSV